MSLNPARNRFYFTLQGRLTRIEYFKGWVGLLVLGLVLQVAFAALMLLPPLDAFQLPLDLLGFVAWLGAVLLLAVANICLAARRWHDLDCSGWFNLLYLLPGVNFIVLLVMMFLPGTPGANRFGPDPLAAPVATPFPRLPAGTRSARIISKRKRK